MVQQQQHQHQHDGEWAALFEVKADPFAGPYLEGLPVRIYSTILNASYSLLPKLMPSYSYQNLVVLWQQMGGGNDRYDIADERLALLLLPAVMLSSMGQHHLLRTTLKNVEYVLLATDISRENWIVDALDQLDQLVVIL